MAKYIVVHSVRVATEFVPETFGRLTTLGPKFRLRRDRRWGGKVYQVCSCCCGNATVVAAEDLRSGHTKSCGCLSRETPPARTHGRTGTPEYICWSAIQQRCYYIKHKDYDNYGGRGIRVCDRWLDPENGFLNFLEDMGPKAHKNLSIERELVNGDYCPENCRWATVEEQAYNKRNNINITFEGKTQCIAAWAEELGIQYATLRSRIVRGWPVDKALNTPLKVRGER